MEEVFKISGVPIHTFVHPKEYPQLIVNLRTPGRGLVIEGPSGIGKTSAVETALQELGLTDRVMKLSARKADDVRLISELASMPPGAGVVIIDDFHKLPDDIRAQIADFLKTLADEERGADKLIVVGINKAGENLINFAHDLVNRLDIITFETNFDFKVAELIDKGEAALAIHFNVKDEITALAQGSFYLAQMLCHEVCLHEGILEAADPPLKVNVSLEGIRSAVWERLGRSFKGRCQRFCRGTKFRSEGRAPYLHILRWLAESDSWTLSLRDATREHKEMRGSVGQVVDKGFLNSLINGDQEIRAALHYDPTSEQLTVEDPQFLFYIRQIRWRQFAVELGFVSVDFERRYDFALSFAGPDRYVADALASSLAEKEVEVFYDRYEQHRILAEDVEEYLRPIYQSEAQFVVVLLGPEYPKRIWAKIESDAFRERMKDGAVVPIWFSDAAPSIFDESRRVGGIEFSRAADLNSQVEMIAEQLMKKLRQHREEPLNPAERTDG
jgi:hypothetical protein